MQNAPQHIGLDYVESEELPWEDSDLVWDLYRKITQVNDVLYDQIPVPVVWTDDDPYDDYADMARSVGREQCLKVFTGGIPDEFEKADVVKSRAVHDWYGHLGADVDFSFLGEFAKWRHVKELYPPECRMVLFGIVVGQVSAAYYLDDGFADDRFEQRLCIAPDRWLHWARKQLFD